MSRRVVVCSFSQVYKSGKLKYSANKLRKAHRSKISKCKSIEYGSELRDLVGTEACGPIEAAFLGEGRSFITFPEVTIFGLPISMWGTSQMKKLAIWSTRQWLNVRPLYSSELCRLIEVMRTPIPSWNNFSKVLESPGTTLGISAIWKWGRPAYES